MIEVGGAEAEELLGDVAPREAVEEVAEVGPEVVLREARRS